MNNPQKLDLPQAIPTVDRNGDIAIEFVHRGEVVGSLNATKIMSNWFARLGWFQPPARQEIGQGGQS